MLRPKDKSHAESVADVQVGWILPTLVALAVILSPSMAFAQSTTLGQAFETFQSGSVGAMIMVVIAVAFVGGAYVFATGLVKLKDASDTNGTQVKYSEGLMRLAAGSFLVSIVSTVLIGLASIGADGNWNLGIAASRGSTVDLEDGTFVTMMANFAIDAAGPLSTLVLAVSVLIGISLVAASLFGFAKLNSAQAAGRDSFGSLATKFLIGVMLTNVYWVIEVVSNSFGFTSPFAWVGGNNFSHLGEQARTSLLSYVESGSVSLPEQAKKIMELAFMGLVPFGLIAFVRGLLIIKDSVEANKQASIGSGMVYLLAGVALVNAKVFSCTVSNTFIGGGGGWCS